MVFCWLRLRTDSLLAPITALAQPVEDIEQLLEDYAQELKQIESEIDKGGQGELEKLIYSGELWTVKDDGSVSRGPV